MITELQMGNILDQALSTGADFAELFFEDREDCDIPVLDGSAQGVKRIRICDAGLHVLRGVERVYVYSNDMGYDSLMSLAKRAAQMIREGEGTHPGANRNFIQSSQPTPNPIREYPSEVSYHKKIAMLQRLDHTARIAGPAIRTLQIDYTDSDQRILVANTENRISTDRRIYSRLRCKLTAGDGGDVYSEWAEYPTALGYETFDPPDQSEAFVRELVAGIDGARRAVYAKPCRVPVVLAPGNCGTLWHECCGHGLEAFFIASRNSIYADKLGQRIASDRVTLIDDGTCAGQYGSAAIDDEGHPTQKNILIENGILKQYLCDRLHGRMLGMESNGCGRRQNYTYAPASRMSNTYLAPGQDDEEEMIRSVPEGLYVKQLGGGTGGLRFTLSVKEGYWIRNGQLAERVKGVMLSGNGIDVMRKVDRVGRSLVMECGSFCGGVSGLIPVTASQPAVRISEMSVGGGSTA